MADHEPRKRKKRKSHAKNENLRTDSESDKGAKDLSKDKKSKKQFKVHPQESVPENEGSSYCVKCLFFLLITALAIGIGIVVLSFQATDSPEIFSEDVIEKIQTFISDMMPNPNSSDESDPVVSDSETWEDGNKVDSSDNMEEKFMYEAELEDTYGIHLGKPSNDPLSMDEFPESPAESPNSEYIAKEVTEEAAPKEDEIMKQSVETADLSSQQSELPNSSPDDELTTDLPVEHVPPPVKNDPIAEEIVSTTQQPASESQTTDSVINTPVENEVPYGNIEIDNKYDSLITDVPVEHVPVTNDVVPPSVTNDPIAEEIVSSTQQPTGESQIEELVPEVLAENAETSDSVLSSPVENEAPYGNIEITNEYDYLIKEDLDNADDMLDQSPDQALRAYSNILRTHRHSVRALYGQARAYDRLASIHRSNQFLDSALAAYVEVMTIDDTPDMLYILSADRAANRSIFRGMYAKAVGIQKAYISRFPSNVTARNQLAVSHMMMGQNNEAEKVLKEILTKWDAENGFAKVHLGFILKTHHSNYKESIRYLSEGIRSKAPGTIDGRFFYHLGDAYHRLGFSNEARQVYVSGAQHGIFLSPDQRSLYNVDTLTGKPWWDFSKTKYANSIKLLENNWKVITKEAVSLLNVNTNDFSPESENLQDTGDWKQLELYARGRMNSRNCRLAPQTCNLLKNIPDAVRCSRCQTKFSIMYPGTHVWPHTGPTNCRLRAHLGLVVPAGPRIRVANQTRNWEEGKIIVFDDSFEHEVWHSGDSYRLVLIIDFWHPELTEHQKATLLPI